MIVFNWSIVSMNTYSKQDDKSDVVFQINWSCIASQDGISVSELGLTTIELDQDSSFVPYNELTEQKAWSWIESKVNKSNVEQSLQQKIEAQKNPSTRILPNPWETQVTN